MLQHRPSPTPLFFSPKHPSHPHPRLPSSCVSVLSSQSRFSLLAHLLHVPDSNSKPVHSLVWKLSADPAHKQSSSSIRELCRSPHRLRQDSPGRGHRAGTGGRGTGQRRASQLRPGGRQPAHPESPQSPSMRTGGTESEAFFRPSRGQDAGLSKFLARPSLGRLPQSKHSTPALGGVKIAHGFPAPCHLPRATPRPSWHRQGSVIASPPCPLRRL